jgi:phage-related protein
MMATIIDELMITLGIDSKDAQKGMKEAENTVKGGIKNITSTLQTGLSSVSKIFSGFGAALVGAFSVGTAFSTWKEQVAELGEVSRRLHMSMEDLQGWTGAVGKFGGSASDFENSLRGLSSQLAKMAVLGRSRTGTFLQSLGIDPGELGRQRDALQVLEELAGVMEQMSPDEARAAGQALGFDSSMIMLLQQGRDGMKELIRQKKEDAIYTQEDADAVKAYNVEMGKIKKGFIGIMGVLFRTVLPAFTKVAEVVGKFVNYIRKHQTAVKAFFIMLATLITGLLLPSIMAFFSALLTNPITWVILALAALAAVIEDLIVWLEGGDSALEDFWTELFGSREDAKKTFEEIRDAVQKFVDESIPKLIEFKDDVKDLINTVKELWDEISNSTPWKILQHNILETRREQSNSMQEMEEDAKRLAGGAIENLYGGGGGGGFEVDPIGDTIRNAIQEAQDAASSLWENFTGALSEVWDNVVGALQEGWSSFLEFGSDILNDIAKFAEDTFESIRKFFEDAMKDCENAADHFSSAASSAIAALNDVISSLADNIRTNMIGAIDEASARWQAFQQEVALGNAAIAASAADYSRAGSYSNTSNTEWNVTLNGVENGQQAASDFRHGVGSKFSGTQANAGVW